MVFFLVLLYLTKSVGVIEESKELIQNIQNLWRPEFYLEGPSLLCISTNILVYRTIDHWFDKKYDLYTPNEKNSLLKFVHLFYFCLVLSRDVTYAPAKRTHMIVFRTIQNICWEICVSCFSKDAKT